VGAEAHGLAERTGRGGRSSPGRSGLGVAPARRPAPRGLERPGAAAPGHRPRTKRAFCGEAAALADLACDRALELGPRDLDSLCGKGLANVRWAQTLKAEDNAAAVLRFRIGAEAMEEAQRLDPGNANVEAVLAICALALGTG
jgi:hypothetical protein